MVRPLKLVVLLPSVNSLPNMCLLQLFIGLKGVVRASVGFPGNWWANLMSNSPISGNLPHPLGVKTAALSCRPSAHDGVWLQNLVSDVKDLPSIKPLMARLPTPISFFGLEAGWVQGLLACRVQPNNSTQEEPKGNDELRLDMWGRVGCFHALSGYGTLPVTCLHKHPQTTLVSRAFMEDSLGRYNWLNHCAVVVNSTSTLFPTVRFRYGV